MKVALVTPNWRENPYPPLGLAYIGAVLESDDHKVKIFDLTLDQDKLLSDKINDIVEFSPDIVGISSMSHNYDNAVNIANILKTTGAKIVFGGPHPTIMPEYVLKNDFIDFIITGEGEQTFAKLCKELESAYNFKNIDGLCYKDNGSIIVQPRNSYIENLDDIPFPARHLLDLNKYKLIDDFGHKMATILSSRGCPYRCTYCYKGLFGTKYRQRSPQNIMEEIKLCINEYNYRSFYFIDDLFTHDIDRVKQLTNSIKDLNIDIRWQCLARVNNATYDMFKQMKDSGCYKVHFGIESGNQSVLNKAKKGITLDQVRSAAHNCRKAKIRSKGYFMLGLPGDNVKTMQDTIDFAKELKLDDYMFSITTPFPGTALWETIDRNKISLSNAFYYSCDSEDVRIFYNLSDVSDSDIIEMAKKAREMSDKTNAKIFCEKKFGKNMGFIAWQFSKIPVLKKYGRVLFIEKMR